MRAALHSSERQLVDGQFATVVVKERNEQPRLVIAQAALQLDQAGSFVLIVNPDNKVEMRRATPPPPDRADNVITPRPQKGAQVLVDAAHKARVRQAASPPTQPP